MTMDPGSRPPLELTPELALGYLRELSCDQLAGCVLAEDGRRLAGARVPEDAAGALTSALQANATLKAEGSGRRLFAAASRSHVVVAATGPLSLPGLVFHDLGEMLAALGPGAPPAEAGEHLEIELAGRVHDMPAGPDSALQRACEALLRALTAAR